MRKIGTFTTAFGFIFYGIILLVIQVNRELGLELLKFWPAIFILIGAEILLYTTFNKEGDKKAGFNWLVILVILIYMFTNMFYGIKTRIGNNPTDFLKNIRFNDLNLNKGEERNITNGFRVKNNKIIVNVNDGDIILKKSNSTLAKFEGKIYVRRGYYDSNFTTDTAEGSLLKLDGENIYSVKGTIFIPQGCNIELYGEDMNIENRDDFTKSNIYVKGDNLKLQLENFNTLKCDNSSGLINVEETSAVIINSESAKIDIKGNTKNVKIDTDSGLVTVKNDICENINIKSFSGEVNVDTKDSNLKINASTDSGIVKVDGESAINGNIDKTLGNGRGIINISTDSGIININTR